jgi:hypothetical protein
MTSHPQLRTPDPHAWMGPASRFRAMPIGRRRVSGPGARRALPSRRFPIRLREGAPARLSSVTTPAAIQHSVSGHPAPHGAERYVSRAELARSCGGHGRERMAHFNRTEVCATGEGELWCCLWKRRAPATQ